MKTRRAGRLERIGVAIALAFLACGTATASEDERHFPVIRDAAGSGMTIEFSPEGPRPTAIPFLTLHQPTVRRIEDRIARKIADFAAKEIPSGTRRSEPGVAETAVSTPPPVPEEITARSVRDFVKSLRAYRKEKQEPTVGVAAPERRLGMAGASPHGN